MDVLRFSIKLSSGGLFLTVSELSVNDPISTCDYIIIAHQWRKITNRIVAIIIAAVQHMLYRLYRIHHISDYFLYQIGLSSTLYRMNPICSVSLLRSEITPLWKWYVSDYLRYRITVDLVWMHESNTLSLGKLSLSCRQLCFQASINFQAMKVAMKSSSKQKG